MNDSKENEINKSKSFNKFEVVASDEYIVKNLVKRGKFALNFIINKYKNFVKLKSKTYFLVGAEKEDVYQEGMLGLFKAIKNFNDSKSSSFRNFAEVCIRRQIITAIKTANRKKHTPLNSYISLNSSQKSDDDHNGDFLNVASSSKNFDPQEVFSFREICCNIKERINEELSKFEKKAFGMYINGLNYQEIAERLKKTPKSVDNAIQRAKRKMNRWKKIICN